MANVQTFPLDGNGRSIMDIGYDPVLSQFAVQQTGISSQPSGAVFPIAPAISQPASQNAAVAAGTGTSAQTIKASAGFLSGVLITANASAAMSIYDNASAASGTVIGYIPATAVAGQYYPFNMPAMNGITAGKVNGSAAITVAYS